MTITEGELAPDFSLQNQENQAISLSDLKGKNIILYFYPKDDTPGCTKEACGFRDAWSEIQALGVVVYGVSPDDAASHRRFISKYELPFALLCDPQKQMMEAYGAWGEKNMYGKKVVGTIRSTVWIGTDGRVKKHWKKVPDAAAHPAKVLQAVRGG